MKGWQGAGDLRGTLQVSALEGGIRKHQENPVSGSLVLSANPSSLPTALGLRRKASYRDGIWAFVRHLRICLGSLETQNIITIEYISISPPISLPLRPSPRRGLFLLPLTQSKIPGNRVSIVYDECRASIPHSGCAK